MDKGIAAFGSIDEYIEQFPSEVRSTLETLRRAIREAAPKATERISYNMPAFALNGALVYFAAYKKHIGFYPTGSGIDRFKQELSEWKGSKGAVQFPLDKPLPLELIDRIVKFRAAENRERAALKRTLKR